MFYIFYVSILDFDVKKIIICYCDFLQLIPQSVSNVFLNMYSFCYEAVITVNFIILLPFNMHRSVRSYECKIDARVGINSF